MGILETIKEFFTMGLARLRKTIEKTFNPTEQEEQVIEEQPLEETKTGYEEKPVITEQLLKEKPEIEDEEDLKLVRDYSILLPTFLPEQLEFVNRLFEKYIKTKEELAFYKKEAKKLEEMKNKYTVYITLTGSIKIYARIEIKDQKFLTEMMQIEGKYIVGKFIVKEFPINLASSTTFLALNKEEIEYKIFEHLENSGLKSSLIEVIKAGLYNATDDLRREFNFYNLSDRDVEDSIIVETISSKMHNELTNIEGIIFSSGINEQNIFTYTKSLDQFDINDPYQNFELNVFAKRINYSSKEYKFQTKKMEAVAQFHLSIEPTINLNVSLKSDQMFGET